MGDSPGYNPYRKSNGEFASKGEVGDLSEKLTGDLEAAQSSGDVSLVSQIESYAMEKMPESPIGRKLLEEKYGDAATTQKGSVDYSQLGGRELQKLAKDTEDEALQLEIARRGSSAARKNLARNVKATPEALQATYEATDDDAVRKELASNLHSDLSKMSKADAAYGMNEAANRSLDEKDRGLRKLYAERAQANAKADWVDDSTVEELRSLHEAGARSRRVNAFNNPLVNAAMGNDKNKISEPVALDFAKQSRMNAAIAIGAGRISQIRLGKIPAGFVDSSRVKDPGMLDDLAKVSARGEWDKPEIRPYGEETDKYGYDSRQIVNQIIDNPNTSAATLDRLADNPRAKTSTAKLYRHPNATPETKRKLEESSPLAYSYSKIHKTLNGRTPDELRAELIVAGSETSTQRGYHRTELVLDRAKIEAYGFTRFDVENVMGGDGSSYRYDPETGRYSGGYDSGE